MASTPPPANSSLGINPSSSASPVSSKIAESPGSSEDPSSPSYSEENYKKLKRKLRETMTVNTLIWACFATYYLNNASSWMKRWPRNMIAPKRELGHWPLKESKYNHQFIWFSTINLIIFFCDKKSLLLDSIGRMDHRMIPSSDENSSDLQSELSASESDNDESKFSLLLMLSSLSDTQGSALDFFSTSSKNARLKRRVTSSPQHRQNQSSYSRATSSATSSPQRSNAGRDLATVASAPPKRSKFARIPVKTRRVQPIERDEHGQPKLPQQIGVLTVQSLGKIVSDRDTFHNERYIFPVGYTVSRYEKKECGMVFRATLCKVFLIARVHCRTYPSMVDPNANTVVTSTILDGGDGPLFRVTAADAPDDPIIANSATGAWTVVVRRSNEIRNREHSNSASGPDYYGFKHPTIAKLIQDLPGTENLRHYVAQNFEEMEPRAAKGVMAAAEKKRGNLEQMGNANRRAPRAATDHDDTMLPISEEAMNMEISPSSTGTTTNESPHGVKEHVINFQQHQQQPPSLLPESSHHHQHPNTTTLVPRAPPPSYSPPSFPDQPPPSSSMLSSDHFDDDVDRLNVTDDE